MAIKTPEKKWRFRDELRGYENPKVKFPIKKTFYFDWDLSIVNWIERIWNWRKRK